MNGRQILAKVSAFLIVSAFVLFNTSPLRAAEILRLFHPDIVTQLTTKGSDGHQLGDVRVTSIPVMDSSGIAAGRMDATLITTGIDRPTHGDETRMSELVFTLNDSSVLIIGGAGDYPAQGPTLSRGVTLVRPIKGGSGRFAGVLGWAESTHGLNGGWTHTFHQK